MPTKHVSADTMEVGKKGGGKHWTKAEVEARQAAADVMKRTEPITLVAPSWLGLTALEVWDATVANAENIKVLDVLDTDMLATYCDAVAQYRRIAKKKRKTVADVQMQQAWARIMAQYADKLGLTPAARARLAKKMAEKPEDTFGKRFD